MNDEMKTQRCSTCKCEKWEACFDKNRLGRRPKTCNDCRAKGKAYREANNKKKKEVVMIYPTSVYKYIGGIGFNKKNGMYRARIRGNQSTLSKLFETYFGGHH